ncbi:MAG: 50S ribosomal protein L9 [Spirochaetaceae bacterium]|jgi:large subunit ribosomal protein L9|nr:50S ribosomal protein L9 [Spirochaetaceae bacterium]
MKVILNKDLYPLGEEGDIKDVARGYARNYLFPRGIALPYTDKTVKLFDARREEIEARKAEKRNDAMGIKERLEALDLVITMPAGANGKLYGAVTAQTVVEELAKHNYQTERKRVEIPGNSIKSVGKHKVVVKLYENAAAEISITVQAQVIKTETRAAPPRKDRRRHGVEAEGASPVSAETGGAAPDRTAEEPGQTQTETREVVRDQEPVSVDL